MQFSDVFGEGSNNSHEYINKDHTGTNPFAPSKNDVWVSNSLFHDCTSTKNGGAISCSTSIQRIFIEETTFTTCKTTNSYGGGIYFSNTGYGQCAIFRTCSFNCSLTSSNISFGQYAYIYTKNDATYKNEVNETTITGSKKKENTKPYRALSLDYSNIICSSVNITNNECYIFAALSCTPSKNASFCTCCIMYTSIVNNSANGGFGCIVLALTGTRQSIITSNIINNKQDDKTSNAIISTYANLSIKESCIIGNEGDKVFYEQSRSSQITITNCTLDSYIINQVRYDGALTIVSSKEYSFINAFSHIVTEKCESMRIIFRKIPEKDAKSTKKGKTCYNKRRNSVPLTYVPYLCMVMLS